MRLATGPGARHGAYVATSALLLLALSGCAGGEPSSGTAPGSTDRTTAASESESEATPTTTPASTPTSAQSSTQSGTQSSKDARPEGGTAERPAAVTAATDLLDWRPVTGSVRDNVTRSGDWTLRVPRNGSEYTLDGPDSSHGSGQPGTRVSDALVEGRWAVVVLQDEAEQRPSIAEVTDLTSGKTFRVDGGSDVPTVNGGTWALGGDRLLHATIGPGRSYCVATVDLRSRRSTLGWCAPARHGFNGAHLTPAGDSLLTFDDGQPSCRTLMALDGARTTPFAGVARCKAWDGLLTDGGAVWSVIPKENRIEDAHFYAREGDGYFDLGPGTAGSLVWCGGAAYFARDPQREGEAAALMRWSPAEGLTVAYKSPGGQAFLAEPRCGGDALTVTALAEGGDEQVTASLS